MVPSRSISAWFRQVKCSSSSELMIGSARVIVQASIGSLANSRRSIKISGKMLNECSMVAAARFLEMRRDERVVDFVQRADELLAVAAAPLLASDEPADLAAGEGYFFADRLAVVGVLLEERDEHLMRQGPGLAEARIGADDDVLVGDCRG